MRKHKEVRLPKISADQIAKNLRSQFPKNRLTGDDKAWQIANGLAKSLSHASADDFNPQFFNPKDVKKSVNVWTQVRNILAKHR